MQRSKCAELALRAPGARSGPDWGGEFHLGFMGVTHAVEGESSLKAVADQPLQAAGLMIEQEQLADNGEP